MKRPFRVIFRGTIGAPRLELVDVGINLDHTRDLAKMAAQHLGDRYTHCDIFDGDENHLETSRFYHEPVFRRV
jgi:hypothetical protein